MALLLGFKKTNEGGTIDACGQVYSLASGALLDTLKHPFENAHEISSLDYSRQHHSFFGVDRKTNHIFGWSLQRKNRKYHSFNVNAKPHILCLSNCGTFCAAAVGASIHIWQIISGNLLCVLSSHFQQVSVLKFTDDDRFLVSGGEDGLLVVWDLTNCVAISDVVGSISTSAEQRTPLFKWNEHSQPVTGIAIGLGGIRTRIFSCSLDHSFRIWDLLCGRLLLTLSFDVPLTAVAVDGSETRAFVASELGRIFQINLFAPPSSAQLLNANSQSFDGHQSPCRNLAVSSDGLTLVSCGSTGDDKNVRIWDVASRQCLRVIKVKGEMTEMRLLDQVPLGYNDNEEQRGSVTVLKPFHRNVTSLKVFTLTPSIGCEDDEVEEDICENKPATVQETVSDVASLSGTNRRLYDFMVSKVLSGELNGGETAAVGRNTPPNVNSNNDEDDVIIVEHSGEEDEPASNQSRKKGRQTKPIRTRHSNRLQAKKRN